MVESGANKNNQNYSDFELLDATDHVTMDDVALGAGDSMDQLGSYNQSKSQIPNMKQSELTNSVMSGGVFQNIQMNDDYIISGDDQLGDIKIKKQNSLPQQQQNYQLQYVQKNIMNLQNEEYINRLSVGGTPTSTQNRREKVIVEKKKKKKNRREEVGSSGNYGSGSKKKKQHHHQESSSSSSEDDVNSDEEIEEVKDEDDPTQPKEVDYKQTVLNGSFLPAISLLQNNLIDIETIIDENQGLRLLHYASYFGKIKALKTLCEVYKADVNSIDYRAQTSLHVACSSGELGATIYLTSLPSCNKDPKDNALMTPLMNSVQTVQSSLFVHLHFKEQCELKNVDLNGNSLLHLCAKSNNINVARLLRHIYQDQIKEDSNFEINSGTPSGRNNNGNEIETTRSSASSYYMDNMVYFDVNRVNNLGQTPIYMTINTRSYDMLKFLLYMLQEQKLLSTYLKYENRILINAIFTTETESFKENLIALVNNFRWSVIFVKELYRYFAVKLTEKFNYWVLVAFYVSLYALHWIYVVDTSSTAESHSERQDSSILLMLFHLVLLFQALNLCFFYRAGTSAIEKKHIHRDRDQNLVGQLLYLMEARQLHKIEEMSKRYCYECLIIRSKFSDHCKHCNQCISFRQKHSRFFNRCIGDDNVRHYYLIYLLNQILLILYLLMAVNSYIPICDSTTFIFHIIETFTLMFQRSKLLFVYNIGIILLQINFFEEFVHLTVAIGRQLTLMQLKNVWQYKHCFKVKSANEDGELDEEEDSDQENHGHHIGRRKKSQKKNMFELKDYSLFQQVKNLFLFLVTGRNVIGKSKSGAKKFKNSLGDTSYVDLQTSQRTDISRI
eukprot:403361177